MQTDYEKTEAELTRNVYERMGDDELARAIESLKAEVEEVKAQGLKLDMARGKPSPAQVDISRPMLDLLTSDADLTDGGIDCSNYGCFEGIPSARRLAAPSSAFRPTRRSCSVLEPEHHAVRPHPLLGEGRARLYPLV